MARRQRMLGGVLAIATAFALCSGPGMAQGAQRVQSLVIGMVGAPQSLIPAFDSSGLASQLVPAVLPGLVQPDRHGASIPNLAASWKVAANGLTYTFTLRKGLQWSDGKLLTSRDLLFTYSYFHARTLALHPSLTSAWSVLTSITAPTTTTFVLRLKQVFAPLLATIGALPVLPAHLYTGTIPVPTLSLAAAQRNPFPTLTIASGPYRVADWVVGDHLTLIPNRSYWGTPGSMTQLRIQFYPNLSTLLAQIRANHTDIAVVGDSSSTLLKGVPKRRVVTLPSANWYHLDLTPVGPLRDQRVRHALDLATPRSQILRQLWGGAGQAAVADVAPSSWAFATDIHGSSFNIKAAAAQLTAAGFRKGRSGLWQQGKQSLGVDLWSAQGDTIALGINQQIATAWRTLGISVTLRTTTALQLLGAAELHLDTHPAAIGYSWTTLSDPDTRAYWTHTSPVLAPLLTANKPLQQQLEALSTSAIKTTDQARRKSLYHDEQRLLATQIPLIAVAWEPAFYLVPPTLKNFAPTPWGGLLAEATEWVQ